MSVSVKLEVFFNLFNTWLVGWCVCHNGLALQSTSAAEVLGQRVSWMSAARYCCHHLVTDDKKNWMYYCSKLCVSSLEYSLLTLLVIHSASFLNYIFYRRLDCRSEHMDSKNCLVSALGRRQKGACQSYSFVIFLASFWGQLYRVFVCSFVFLLVTFSNL